MPGRRVAADRERAGAAGRAAGVADEVRRCLADGNHERAREALSELLSIAAPYVMTTKLDAWLEALNISPAKARQLLREAR
ncbi:MAG: hypothetical protein KC503_21020 [Myxococcales bacterium]|nr:hypothetical protein [Myxococcales bacterium]